MSSSLRKGLFFVFLVISTGFIAPIILNAQEVQFVYTIDGGGSFTWIEPQSPTPSSYVPGFFFEIDGVASDPSGGGSESFLAFYNTTQGGGFTGISSEQFTDTFAPTNGEQVYSGPESSPTFIIGTYTGINETGFSNTGPDATLMISEVTVPEPSMYVILAGTLWIGTLAAARRRKVSV